MQRQNGTDDEEAAPRVTRSLRKRLNSVDQDVIHVVDTPTKKTLEPISEDKSVTNKKTQQILEKTAISTPTKRMTRRNSILIEESERSESPSVLSSAKKLNSSTLTEENVAQLSQSVPARRTRRATSITESEQREGTPIVRRSARRNSITSDDGSVVSNASALRVTRSNRKSVHVPEDVLLEADENEDESIPATPQIKLRKIGVKSPSLSPQISTIVTRSASRSPSLPISPEKTVVATELNQSKNESLIKTVLNKSMDCSVSLDDVTKVKSPVKIIVEEAVRTPPRKTPIKEIPIIVQTPKSPKFATPKTKTPIKEIEKLEEKTPEKQKTPIASRSVCFDKSVTENSGIKYAATPRSQKNGSKIIDQSIYEISEGSKDHSVDISQNESSVKIKDLNQTDLIITDIVNAVTTNITNSSMSESILPLVNLEKEGTPLKNKKLDCFNSSTPITLLGKSNYLEKTPLQPILKKNVSLSSSKKKTESEEKITEFSKSWSQSIVNKIEVTSTIDAFGVDKEDDVIKTKSPKKKNQFDSEYSDTEFQYSDGEENVEEEEEKEKNEFIDDEAMENNEDSMDPEERQYIEDNEISEGGISIGSKDTDAEEEDDESKDSFIVTDEEVELLDGSGDDLSHHSPTKLNGSAKKQRKRIIDNSSSEEEVEEIKSPKKTPAKLKEPSPVVEEEAEEAVKEISSDEETKKITENFNSFLKELNSSHKNDSDDELDEDFVVASEEESEDLEEEENSDIIRAEEEEINYRETILKKFTGTKVNQLNESANKSLNKSVKDISPEVSLLNTTFSKTDEEEEEVNADEKENEETTNSLNVSQKLLSKTKKSVTPLRKSLNVVQNSPALNQSTKNLLNVSTASASGGFIEENLETVAVKTPLKLKRDVAAEKKKVTLSEVKKRCDAILHATEANKKILREQYKSRLQEEGADEKILLKRQKRKQKLEEKQRKAEEKAEIAKAFKHSKQLLLEAQLKKFAEAKEETNEDSYVDESEEEIEIIPPPQKKKSKKTVTTDEEEILSVKPTKKSKKRQIEVETSVLVEKKKKKLKQNDEEVELPALVKKNKNKKKEMEAEQVIDALFHKFDESESDNEEPEKKKKKKKKDSTSNLREEPKKKKKQKTSISSTSDFNVSVLETTPQKKKSKLRMLEKLSSNFVEEPVTPPPTKIQSTFKESPITPKHYNVVNIKSVPTKIDKVKKAKKVRKIVEPENVLPKPTWGESLPKKKRVLSLSEESHHMKGFQVEELEPTLPKATGFVNSAIDFKKKLAQNTTGRHPTKSLLNTLKKKKFN